MLISWSLDDTNTKTGGSFRIDFSQRSKLFLAADEANVSIEMQPEDFAQRLKKMDPHKRDPLPLHVTYVFISCFYLLVSESNCFVLTNLRQMGMVPGLKRWIQLC